MPSFLELKDDIRGFIVQALPSEYKTVYWQSERQKIPTKPYCMLTELSESIDLNTSELQLPNSLTKQMTEYKTATITIAVYVDGLKTSTSSYSERKEFAYSSLNKVRTLFDTMQTRYKFKNKFAIRSLSSIRPLNEAVDGGYLYRYEFDLTVGFNETYEYDLPVSRKVIIDLEDIQIQVPEVNG